MIAAFGHELHLIFKFSLNRRWRLNLLLGFGNFLCLRDPLLELNAA